MSEKKGARLWEDQRGDSQTLHQAVPSGTQTQAQVSLSTTVESGDSVFTPGILGQVLPTANVLTTLYTVPANTHVSATLRCVNQDADDVISISLALGGATDSPEQYIAFETALKARQAYRDSDIMLGPGDVVRVLTPGTVSFTLTGQAITDRV